MGRTPKRERKGGTSPRVSGVWPCQHLHFRLLVSRLLRGYVSIHSVTFVEKDTVLCYTLCETLSQAQSGIPCPDSVWHVSALQKCFDLRTSLLHLKHGETMPCSQTSRTGHCGPPPVCAARLSRPVPSGQSLPSRPLICAGSSDPGRLGDNGLSWPWMLGNSLSRAVQARRAFWHYMPVLPCGGRRPGGGAAVQGSSSFMATLAMCAVVALAASLYRGRGASAGTKPRAASCPQST